MSRNVLLIDNDLYFGFWFGRALDAVGYEAYPAKSVPDAMDLIAELRLRWAVLIINRALPGADDLIASLRKSDEDLRVIELVGSQAREWPEGIDGVCMKPARVSDEARAELVQTVERIASAKGRAQAIRSRR